MPDLYIVLIRNYNNFSLSIFKKVELTNVNDMSPVFDRTSFPPANKISLAENKTNDNVWEFKASDVDKMGPLSFQFENSEIEARR